MAVRNCNKCGGKGEVACYFCKGAGQVPDEYSNLVNCRECGGIAVTTCDTCNGSGKINY